MSYARNLLSRGEEVVHESRQHWLAVMARTWIWIVVAILSLAVVIWAAGPDNTGGFFDILQVGGIAVLLVALAWIGIVVWDWRNQEWLITTRRVIRAEGILNKAMSDSNLEKINDARLTQSWVGRIFNYGTLDILTAAEEVGGTQVADFPMIADPVEFKVAMLNQKELLERPDLAPPRYQRQAPPPEMERAEPMPPRAGSDRVAIHADDEGDEEDDALPAPPVAVGGPPDAEPIPEAEPEAASAAPRRSSPVDELAETLERLAGLRDRGLITPEEYDAKKRELLERM